jgi:hypothetical protein
MLNSLSQIPNSPNEPSGKTTENGLAISDTTAVESLSADPVEQFSLIASDDSELVLKRIDISSVEIDKYIQIPTLGSIRDGVVAKSMLSSFAGSATQLGSIAAANPNGIFLVQADSVSKRKMRHYWGYEHTKNTSQPKL